MQSLKAVKIIHLATYKATKKDRDTDSLSFLHGIHRNLPGMLILDGDFVFAELL